MRTKTKETIDDKVYGVAVEGTQTHFGQIVHSSTMAACHAYIKSNKLTLSAAEEADKENQSASKLKIILLTDESNTLINLFLVRKLRLDSNEADISCDENDEKSIKHAIASQKVSTRKPKVHPMPVKAPLGMLSMNLRSTIQNPPRQALPANQAAAMETFKGLVRRMSVSKVCIYNTI